MLVLNSEETLCILSDELLQRAQLLVRAGAQLGDYFIALRRRLIFYRNMKTSNRSN